MTVVVPAILEKDFSEIEKKVEKVKGLCDWIQIDIADNTLVPNSTFIDPVPFARFTHVNLELHMMVKNPLAYANKFIDAGFRRLIAHVEADNIEEFIALCEEKDVEVGLAVNGPTSIEKIKKYIEDVDVILIMAIDAGFSGKPFRPDTIEKIKWLHENFFDMPIEVDGAMDDVNAKKAVEAGASRINSNSYIFNSKDVKVAIETLKNLG